MKIFLKIIISLFFIGLLLYKVDWESFKNQIGSSDLYLLSIVLIIKTLQFPISAHKWRKSLEIHELYYPFKYLQKILCIGFFFNNFLPTSIGGDGYRVIKTFPQEGAKSRAISALLLERIIGLAALLFLGVIGAAILVFRYESDFIKLYLICGVVVLSFFPFFFILHTNDHARLAIRKFFLVKKWEVIFHNLRYITNNRKRLLEIVVFSVLFHLQAIIAIFLIFKAFMVQNSFINCAVIAAFTGIASILPISINGIGVMEGAFVYVAMQVGVPFDHSVIVALMSRALTIPFSLVCGVIYLINSVGTSEKSTKKTT